ncbi:MAG: RidA family protein [Candidatus Latescibacterota bacterium]|nr:RidA family protein [Candidatus Latescibacterota bacterium]
MAHGFNVPGVVEPFGAFSSAAWEPENGRVLHLSGHVSQALDGSTVGVDDIQAQTRQVLENLRDVLAHVGGTLDDVARVTVYVTDVANVPAIHEVRREFFAGPYPASTLVQVAALIDPDWLIEIDAVAVIPCDRVPAS